MRSTVASILFLGGIVTACGSIAGPSDNVSPGVWGGKTILMTVTANGATIEHDCDSGAFDGALAPDHAGHFSIVGTYSFGRGGPIEFGTPPAKKYAARYDGTVVGRTMQLTIFVPELSRTIGEFSLQLGQQELLERCL